MNWWLVTSLVANVALAGLSALAIGTAFYNRDLSEEWRSHFNSKHENLCECQRTLDALKQLVLEHNAK